MKKFVIIAFIIVIFLIIIFSTCNKKEKDNLPINLYGAILVNDVCYAQLDKGIPLYVECIINNPFKDKELKITGLFEGKPVCRNDKGSTIKIEFKELKETRTVLSSGGMYIKTWRIISEIAEGAYTVCFDFTPQEKKLKKYGIRNIVIDPARLEITNISTDAKTRAYYERRMILLEGNKEQYLKMVQEELGKNPDDFGLKGELVDALELNGQFKEAKRKLMGIALEIEQKQAETKTEQQIQFPDWIAFKLEDINAKIK